MYPASHSQFAAYISTHLCLGPGTSSVLDLAFCSPWLALHLEWTILSDLHDSDQCPIIPIFSQRQQNSDIRTLSPDTLFVWPSSSPVWGRGICICSLLGVLCRHWVELLLVTYPSHKLNLIVSLLPGRRLNVSPQFVLVKEDLGSFTLTQNLKIRFV
jgi:hypothetical protein